MVQSYVQQMEKRLLPELIRAPTPPGEPMSTRFCGKIHSLVRSTFVVIALALTSNGCESDNPDTCYPGDQRACTCSNGMDGFQQCNAAGDAFGACTCNEATGSSSSSSSSSGTAGAGGAGGAGGAAGAGGQGGGSLLPFMSPCTASSQCESMICHEFNIGVSLCTKKCANDNDCPLPSPGCNNMGLCKRP